MPRPLFSNACYLGIKKKERKNPFPTCSFVLVSYWALNDTFKKEKFGGYAYNHDTIISLCFISSMTHLSMAITLDIQHRGSCLQKCIEVKEQDEVLGSTLAAPVFYNSLLQIKYVSHVICLQGDIIHLSLLSFLNYSFVAQATLEVWIFFCLSFQGVRI